MLRIKIPLINFITFREALLHSSQIVTVCCAKCGEGGYLRAEGREESSLQPLLLLLYCPLSILPSPNGLIIP